VLTETKDTAAKATNRWFDAPISVVDLFTIGIGPSSSHTVGPMRAAYQFVQLLGVDAQATSEVTVELYGSLALTGKGHSTDIAVLLGLSGWQPEKIDPDQIPELIDRIRNSGVLALGGITSIHFREADHLKYRKREFLPRHPNAMRLTALFGDRRRTETFYSVGGGAVVREGDDGARGLGHNLKVPNPFTCADDLLRIGRETGLSIGEIMLANERVWRDETQTFKFLEDVRAAMFASIENGCRREGILPGGLKVRRRARALYESLIAGPNDDPLRGMDWVSVYAIAVNEENAAGGRIVTAPTNGAAGVIPAVLKYYETFIPGASRDGARKFLLTAAAIGALYKKRASISAAEMGCQGEIGVACSMAAGAYAAVLGGSNAQIENAAEIGMEHNLGLTCDPIKGLVQVPCIERNTMGAVKAINAARIALKGDGMHLVSLDAVIETMRQTGEDMRHKYKETSLGGLAVNVVEC
jgi:L-serine dehydratase